MNDNKQGSKDQRQTTPTESLAVYASAPHPCSYIDGEEAEALFIDPNIDIKPEQYSHLATLGFRRSGKLIYRPDCQHCQACIPIRLPVKHFKASKSQKRIIKKNADLVIEQISSIEATEFYQLYENYINQRHADGDMYPADEEQYLSFLGNALGSTQYFTFSTQDKLIAVAVVDRLDDGLSAVYTFFDPTENERSLGTFAVLWQIEHAKALELNHLYLGYWVKGSQKMEYKSRFKPAEILINQQWRPLIT